MLVAPAALRAAKESTQASHHRYAGTVRRSLRNGLRLIPRSPRSTGLDSLRRLSAFTNRLDPSVGGSGPRGLARPRRCRNAGDTFASIASRSNVCGDWPNAPPGGSGTGGSKHRLLKSGRVKFRIKRNILLDLSGKSVLGARRKSAVVPAKAMRKHCESRDPYPRDLVGRRPPLRPCCPKPRPVVMGPGSRGACHRAALRADPLACPGRRRYR